MKKLSKKINAVSFDNVIIKENSQILSQNKLNLVFKCFNFRTGYLFRPSRYSKISKKNYSRVNKKALNKK